MIRFQPVQAVRVLFGYDAVTQDARKKRSPAKTATGSEDTQITRTQYKNLLATARDQRRNIVLVAWLIRKHLDYVSRFQFQSRTGDKDFDNNFERLMRWWGRPENCDIAGRHGLTRFIRLAEASRTVDGDLGIVLLRNGRIQAIEADRIKTPDKTKLPKSLQGKDVLITNGVVLDSVGRATQFLVNKRVADSKAGQLEFERAIRARDFIHHAYFDRFDQVRGISPLASALNTMRDLYEAFDYTFIKIKMHSLFGIFIRREPDTVAQDFVTTDVDTGEDPTADTSRYEFELKPGVKIEGDPGDSLDTIESKTPSSEFKDYSKLMIHCALLALDLPMSFFDVAPYNYSGARLDLLQYIESAKVKRDENRRVLDRLTAWKLNQWLNARDPETGGAMLVMPDGMTARDVRWQWIATGIPWIDPLKEVDAHRKSIAIGLRSRQQISAEMGLDWNETIDQLEAEEQTITEKGVTIQVADPGALTTRDEETEGGTNAEE